MRTITITKKEYQDLVKARLRYAYLRQIMEEDVSAPPPTRKREEVLRAFRASGEYTRKFLKSLESGLRRSSYFSA